MRLKETFYSSTELLTHIVVMFTSKVFAPNLVIYNYIKIKIRDVEKKEFSLYKSDYISIQL